MNNAAATLWKTVTLTWLTGPIFDKELRISSRRKRNYILRIAYLFILLIVLSLIWAEEIGSRNYNIAYRASRLSQVGLVITGVIIIVQFYTVQIISVVMLSNSISDEISRKTLGVLMSTPISALQIIIGKLFSKLLQITLLLCLTLPILGIIRVFGGVPWEFLMVSFCITLTSVIFAGMLTLNLSINHKHAYVVIIQSILTLVLLYVLLPLFLGWLVIEQFDVNEKVLLKWVMVTNPLFMMHVLVQELFSPRSVPFGTGTWGWHCIFMLTGSGVLFLRAVFIVRKKALLQACGQLDLSRKGKRLERGGKTRKIRHVKGPPMLWKELRHSTLKMGPIKKAIAIFLIAGSILVSYYIFEKEHCLDEEEIHIMYAMVFSILSVFFTAIFSATTITSEKTSQTWPALLCTLVSDWQIIFAKVLGALRRSAPFWCILLLHVIIFSCMPRYVHPTTLPLYIIVIVPLAFFTTCSGFFFGSVFKHTTSAVVANLIFVALLWGGIPLLSAIIGSIMHMGDDLAELAIMVNPFYFLGEIMNDTAGQGDAGRPWSQLMYSWEIGGKMNFIETTLLLASISSIYIAAGFGFLMIAKTQLRKKIV